MLPAKGALMEQKGHTSNNYAIIIIAQLFGYIPNH